jgi:hypothetical protein
LVGFIATRKDRDDAAKGRLHIQVVGANFLAQCVAYFTESVHHWHWSPSQILAPALFLVLSCSNDCNKMLTPPLSVALLFAVLPHASLQVAAARGTHQSHRHATARKELNNVPTHHDCSKSLIKDCDLTECDEVVAYASRHNEFVHQDSVLIYTPFASVGNVLPSIYGAYELARYFNAALFIDSTEFPALAVAFKPNIVPYNNLKVNSTVSEISIDQYKGEAVRNAHIDITHNTNHMLALRFPDGMLQLPAQRWHRFYNALDDALKPVSVRSFASTGVVPWTQVRFSCFFKAMFQKTVALETYMEMQARAWKFDPIQTDYVAWHIRTGAGEHKSYNLSHNDFTYIHMDSPQNLCHAYKESLRLNLFDHSVDLAEMAATPIFLTSNSIDVKRACVQPMDFGNGTMVPLNITIVDTLLIGMTPDTNMHTSGHESLIFDPRPGIAAFMDWIFLANAKTVFSGGSSFSETAKSMHDTTCIDDVATADLFERGKLRICAAHAGKGA